MVVVCSCFDINRRVGRHRPPLLGGGRCGRPHRGDDRPGAETLGDLLEEIDLAFIDADKTGYAGYYELLLPKVRPAGSWWPTTPCGRGTWPTRCRTTRDCAIRAYNDMVVADDRVDALLVNVGDGLMLARKR